MYYETISRQARHLESQSKWREAAKEWQKIGRTKDVEACMLLAESIERGDAFREDVDNTIGEEPEFAPTNLRAWQQWHSQLNEIYNKHFKL